MATTTRPQPTPASTPTVGVHDYIAFEKHYTVCAKGVEIPQAHCGTGFVHSFLTDGRVRVAVEDILAPEGDWNILCDPTEITEVMNRA